MNYQIEELTCTVNTTSSSIHTEDIFRWEPLTNTPVFKSVNDAAKYVTKLDKRLRYRITDGTNIWPV